MQSKGYRLYSEDVNKVYIRRDVVFNETDFSWSNKEDSHRPESAIKLEVPASIDPVRDVEQQEGIPVSNETLGLRRSERNRRPPVAYGFDEYADSADCESAQYAAFTACHIEEPQTLEEAVWSDQSQY